MYNTVDNDYNNKTRRLSAPTPSSSSSYSNIHQAKSLQGLNTNTTTVTSPTTPSTTYNNSTNNNTNNNASYSNYNNTNSNSSMTLEEIERELIRELHPSMNGGQNYDHHRGLNPKKSGVSARSKSAPKNRALNTNTHDNNNNNNNTSSAHNRSNSNSMNNVIDIDEYINMRKGQNYDLNVLKPNNQAYNNLGHNSDPSPLTDEPYSYNSNNNNSNNNNVSNSVNALPTPTLQLSKKDVLVKKLLK